MWIITAVIFVVTFVMLIIIDPSNLYQTATRHARVTQMPIGASSH
jgi:hypothetical protein